MDLKKLEALIKLLKRERVIAYEAPIDGATLVGATLKLQFSPLAFFDDAGSKPLQPGDPKKLAEAAKKRQEDEDEDTLMYSAGG